MGAAWSGLLVSSTTRSRALLGAACLGVLGSVWLSYHCRLAAIGDRGGEEELPTKCQESVELQIDSAGKITDVYELEKKTLGEGSYGRVFKGRKKDTGDVFAVKTIPVTGSVQRVATEIDVLKSLDHPNIIKLKETYHNGNTVYLVMELAEGGELFDRILDLGHFPEKGAAHCLKQVLGAINYCHGLNICVRGVKPEDIMCMTKDPIDKVIVKLIDAGLWRRFQPGTPMTTKAGTPYYVAPQILAGKYDESCDLWSCGVLLYVMLCGYPPFFGETDVEVLAKVRLGNYFFNAADWKDYSQDAKNLIRMLLKMNPRDRPTAQQALDSAWLKSFA